MSAHRRWPVIVVLVAASLGVAVAQTSADGLLPQDSLARLDTIRITSIRVDGNTVFTSDELDVLTGPYRGRDVSIEELHALRQAISLAYLERGYVNSGVVIPDQRVTDGVFVLRAIEGELSGLTIEGNRRLRERTIANRVERGLASPLNISTLQASLQQLEEDPLVARVNAELVPGAGLGQSELRLGVTEQPPLELTLDAANDRSTSVGEHRATLGIRYHGLIGNGDVIAARIGFTEGVADNLFQYRVPVTSRGTALELMYVDQQTDIVEEPFDRVDIESELESWSLTATRPFRQGYDNSVTGFIGFEHRRSESTLLGEPFSFSAGDVDGRARGSSINAGVEWTRRGEARAWTLRGSVQAGVDALDATERALPPDSDFTNLIGQFELVQNFGARDSRLIARSIVQVAQDPLLAMYKLPVGGRYSVRGYRENQLVRDNAVIASVEYQLPPVRDAAGQPRGNVYLALFADYGAAWDEDDRLATSERDSLASVGIGVLWDPLPALHVESYYGFDLDDPNNPDDSLQDRGFHYRLSFLRRF